jgi:protein O-mannosyl-transferase
MGSRDYFKVFSKPTLHILVICLVTFLAYSNTFTVPFQFDDMPNIVENPLIRSPRMIIDSLTFCNQESPHYRQDILCNFIKVRYIGYVTFAINNFLHGLNVAGYHFINLSIHIVNSMLVYSLVILLFRTPLLRDVSSDTYKQFIAFTSALLFAIHPVQTQAVTYIVQRFTILASMFYLSSLVSYIKWRNLSIEKNPSSGNLSSYLFYIGALLFSILAMKTKEISFTLPLVIVILEVVFFKGKAGKRILPLIPLILTAAIIPYSLLNVNNASGSFLQEVADKTRLLTNVSRMDYLFTEFRVIVTYIRIIIFPFGQNFDYDYPIYRSFFDPHVYRSFLFLLLIAVTGIYLLYHSKKNEKYHQTLAPLVSFGIFWFFITLSVESSFIPIVDVIFEHRVYLPSVGAFIALTSSVDMIVHKLEERWQQASKYAIIVLVVLALSLVFPTYMRNNVWRDRTTLWEDVVAKSPKKLRGYIHLASSYLEKNNIDRAIELYKKALSIDPGYAEAYYSLGCAYASRGDLAFAQDAWKKTLAINPSNSYALSQLGNVAFLSDKLLQADDYYTRALQADYWNIEAHYNLAMIFEKLNRMDEALLHYKIFLKIASPQYNYLVPDVKKRLAKLEQYSWQK